MTDKTPSLQQPKEGGAVFGRLARRSVTGLFTTVEKNEWGNE
jgi:hypothetical protein